MSRFCIYLSHDCRVAKPAKSSDKTNGTGNGHTLQRESWASQSKTVKLTGEKLVKKGLVTAGTEKSEKNLYVKTNVELSSTDEPGVFELVVRRPGADAEKTKVWIFVAKCFSRRFACKSCSTPSTNHDQLSTCSACR